MAHIDITRAHKLTPKKARAAADQAGKHLSEEFGLKYRWEDEALHFERPGVNGHMALAKDSVRIVVRLGLLLLPFKGRIEQEIKRSLDELFAAPEKADPEITAQKNVKPKRTAKAAQARKSK